MKRLLLIIPLALGLVTQSTHAALFDAFLKLDGVEGESGDANHRNEIEILSFQWGMTLQGTNTTANGAGGGAGKVSLQDVHFVAKVSKASPKLMLACATGQHIESASFTIRSPDGRDYLFIKLKPVYITSYQTGGSSGDIVPTDQFSLNFTTITYTYVARDGTETTGEATRPTITQ